jgi:hyperosmotically inducible protein
MAGCATRVSQVPGDFMNATVAEKRLVHLRECVALLRCACSVSLREPGVWLSSHLSHQLSRRITMKTFTSALPIAALASVFAVGTAFAAAAATDAQAPDDTSMKSDQPVTDTWITTKVKTELATTDGVKSTEISVKTVDGVVTLTGVLATDVAVKKAVAATKSIKGVKSVDASGLKSKD